MIKHVRNTFLQLFLLTVIVVCLLPVVFVYSSSFMESYELQKWYQPLFEGKMVDNRRFLHLIPEFFSLSQYQKCFWDTPEYLFGFVNSIILIVPSLIGCFIVAPLAGYGLARFPIPGKKSIIFCYILFSLLPYQTMLVPEYFILEKLGLLGTRWAVWYPAIFNPFPVYLVYRFSQKIPENTIEAARIEGCNEAKIFMNISMPQISAGLVSLFLLEIVNLWNMVEQPMIYLNDIRKLPLTALISTASDFTFENFATTLVCSSVYTIPMLLVFWYCKDDLVESVNQNLGVKL